MGAYLTLTSKPVEGDSVSGVHLEQSFSSFLETNPWAGYSFGADGAVKLLFNSNWSTPRPFNFFPILAGYGFRYFPDADDNSVIDGIHRLNVFLKFGGGVDINLSPVAFLRGRLQYTPSFLTFGGIHPGLQINFGIGYRPEALAKQRENARKQEQIQRLKEHIQMLMEKANAALAENYLDTAIRDYREVIRLDRNHVEARRGFNTAFSRRIEENPQLYPSPLEGRWGNERVPERTETYQEAELRQSLENRHPSLRGREFYVVRRIIPAIPAGTRIWEFKGSRYTSDEGKTGSFYYTGGYYGNYSIELDDGTVLRLENNSIRGSRFVFNRMER